jgi:hypothetical protein
MEAARSYLNPDEIHYALLALPSHFKELYRSGLDTDHPPLLFLLLHPIASVTSSEVALRLIPVLAGTIFPWVVYRWLARVWTAGAGLAALTILTLSPNLISLSAQVRGYTLELLFASLALFFLDKVIQNRSLGATILFSVSLDLAILSEYSALWFAGAVGVYFVLECCCGAGALRRFSPRLLAAWALGQLSALAICAVLYWTSIRPRLKLSRGPIDGFLKGAFPAAHQNLAAFGALATVKQFAYAFSSAILGIGASCLFGAALIILWRGRSPGERTRNRIFAAFLVIPFALACAAAMLYVHPYGRSRHTVILSLFVAAGVGIAIDKVVRVFRPRPWMVGFGVAILGLFWIFAADPDQNNIARSRDRRASMIAGMSYLHSSIPPGSFVLADEEAALYLRFYFPHQRTSGRQLDFGGAEGMDLGAFRVVWRRWDFGEVNNFLDDLASLRGHFGLQPDTPIWVVDGGFDTGIDARLRARFPGLSLPAYRDFDGALTVFQLPPGF